MNTSVNKTLEVMASELWFDADMMHVRLLDGREISVPLEWFPRLRNATSEQRKKWRLIGKGVGIHWEDIDEDISVAALLRVQRTLLPELSDVALLELARSEATSLFEKDKRLENLENKPLAKELTRVWPEAGEWSQR